MAARLVVLVGCGATKLDRPAPARELYTGGLFAKARAWAELHASAWFVVSALHGIVHPDTVLEPYDYRVGGGKADRFRLGQRVSWQLNVALRELWGAWPLPEDRLVILAGADYVGPIREFQERHPGAWPELEDPMAGLMIGQRLAWLSQLQLPLLSKP